MEEEAFIRENGYKKLDPVVVVQNIIYNMNREEGKKNGGYNFLGKKISESPNRPVREQRIFISLEQ